MEMIKIFSNPKNEQRLDIFTQSVERNLNEYNITFCDDISIDSTIQDFILMYAGQDYDHVYILGYSIKPSTAMMIEELESPGFMTLLYNEANTEWLNDYNWATFSDGFKKQRSDDLNRDLIKKYKDKYPEGTRLEMVHMEDVRAIEKGTQGTVKNVDDLGTIHMQWDNGRTLAIVPNEDVFKVIK